MRLLEYGADRGTVWEIHHPDELNRALRNGLMLANLQFSDYDGLPHIATFEPNMGGVPVVIETTSDAVLTAIADLPLGKPIAIGIST